MTDFNALRNGFLDHLSSEKTSQDELQSLCDWLRKAVVHYDWVGIYVMNKSKNQLHLLCYAGEPTDHVVIPFGKGICGQVAVSGEVFVVQDVEEQDNYIACNINVRSEVVFPIYSDGELVAQIDIDSHSEAPFRDEDSLLLSDIADAIGRKWNPDFLANL